MKKRVEIVVEHTPGATPGPWHTGGIIFLNEGRFMNVWGPTPPGAQSGQVVAYKLAIPDARLIAAAPDLYEAAKGIIAAFDVGAFARNIQGDDDPAWGIKALPHLQALAKLVDAVDKAEGKAEA